MCHNVDNKFTSGERAQRPNPRTKIGAFIDNYYPDEVLQSRFVEWKMNETEK